MGPSGFNLSFYLFLINLLSIMADSQVSPITQTTVDFTKAVYDVLRKTEGNVFVSPLSLQVTLAMAHVGATGNTAKEIESGAKFSSDISELHNGFEELLKKLKLKENVTLDLANSIYLANKFKVKQPFVDTNKKVFGAEIQSLDFNKGEEARAVINKWVEDKTHEKIKDLIGQGVLTPNTAAVLVNALYFKGNWEEKFDKTATTKGPFYLTETKTQEVDFMKIQKNFRVAENAELKATILELPYQGQEVSMVLIVPHEKEGLKYVEDKLPETNLVSLLSKVYKREVILSLPKFKLEQTIDAKEVLLALGMKDMFDENAANFSKMSDEQIFVSKAIQKTFIEVNEEGSEAAAATGFKITMRMMPMEPKVYDVNRPFIFMLSLRSLPGIPVFMGRVSEI